MNYLEWSQEYLDTAEKLNSVIIKLKAQRKHSSNSQKKEIDSKLSKYKIYYGECMQIANHLKQRHKEVA